MTMQPAELNLVHESEAQRRHARVKIPAYLQLPRRASSEGPFSIVDLSASGFSIKDKKNDLTKNTLYRGKLMFTLNDIDVMFNVSFHVVHGHSSGHIKGCEFQDLSSYEISLLRVVITKYLSGEIVQAGDVLSTLSRENFTKSRSISGSGGELKGLAKLWAKLVTLCVFIIGCVAFTFVLSSLYDMFFITRAVSASVSIPSSSAIAPREGYIKMLVKPGDEVSAGQPLVTLDSPLLETIAPLLDETMDLSTDELMQMVSSNVSGVIESRCHCIVVKQLVPDGEYLLKGEPVYQLAPVNAEPFIQAWFQSQDVDQITPGTRVSIEFGDRKQLAGTIKNIRPLHSVDDPEKKSDEVLVLIVPDEKIDLNLVDRPVIVNTKPFFRSVETENALPGEKLDGFINWIDRVKL